jgi:hypothetical protein
VTAARPRHRLSRSTKRETTRKPETAVGAPVPPPFPEFGARACLPSGSGRIRPFRTPRGSIEAALYELMPFTRSYQNQAQARFISARQYGMYCNQSRHCEVTSLPDNPEQPAQKTSTAKSHTALWLSVALPIGIATIVFTAYYFSIERYECNLGFSISFPSATIARISCSSPEFLILCNKGSYSSFEETTQCTSSDRRTFKIVDRSVERTKDCQHDHGEHSVYSDGGCACDYRYEMVLGQCLDRSTYCAFLGPQGMAVEKDNQWLCSCAAGFTLSADGKSCQSIADICAQQFGSNAIPAPYDSKSCICKDGFMWSAERTRCICRACPNRRWN